MEKLLTVLLPIKGNESFIRSIDHMPAISEMAENVVYSYNGVYYRRYGNIISEVEDVEFPAMGRPMELSEFTYNANRMGTAPTISATAFWTELLDDSWTQECHVVFKGDKFYLRGIPTSSKDNEDARYRYEIDFVSHWEALEHIMVYDSVSPYMAERTLSESEKFSFFGDVQEMSRRLNIALVHSGISSLRKRSGVTSFLTYKEWNNIPLDETSTEEARVLYSQYLGNYALYLRGEVYEYENGEFVIDGYKVVIDEGVTSDEKFFAFDKAYIYDALQMISDRDNGFGLLYYYKYGTKEIHVGDCEYDFGENNAISYGRYRELLSIKKLNKTETVINRMSGRGSSENIPYYYPNPTPDGWLVPVYNDSVNSSSEETPPTISFPTEEDAEYERFLKCRLGYVFQHGHRIGGVDGNVSEIANGFSKENISGGRVRIGFTYGYSGDEISNPALRLKYTVGDLTASAAIIPTVEFRVYWGKVVNNDRVVPVADMTYNSDTSYSSPTEFQQLCIDNDGEHYMVMPSADCYILSGFVFLDSMPTTDTVDHAGYLITQHYERRTNDTGSRIFEKWGGVDPGEDYFIIYNTEFYDRNDLKAGFPRGYGYRFSSNPGLSGYNGELVFHVDLCLDDSSEEMMLETKITPLTRTIGKYYKDLTTNTIYKCTDDSIYDLRNDRCAVRTFFEASAPEMTAKEWFSRYLSLDFEVFNDDRWYFNRRPIDIADYGLTVVGTPSLFDTITFERKKYLQPQTTLMPQLYYRTDGERRFYNAINAYPREDTSTLDEAAGEYISELSGLVHNDLYKDGARYYDFPNPYIPAKVSESVEDFNDIKPSIKGKEYLNHRIDIAAEYAYDLYDDDSVWESDGGDGTVSGEYKHPHFFIKLRKMPFNLFDVATSEDMEINMTSGVCGSCKFKIKVDENTKKNPVQVWEYAVYTRAAVIRPAGGGLRFEYHLKYNAGDLKRYCNERLFRIVGYRHYEDPVTQQGTSEPVYSPIEQTKYNTYSGAEIAGGLVGTLNTRDLQHIEGDVVTSGYFQERQQDTTQYEVWVALEKDVDTFGLLMPASNPNYEDDSFSVYVRPKSAADVEEESDGDTFVITNIRLPQAYLRDAEEELSKAIIKKLYNRNIQQFNFELNFSRIFLAENEDFLSKLNENSVLYIEYNGRKYKQYMDSYTYRMTQDESLPEISVGLNEELSVVYGGFRNGGTGTNTRELLDYIRKRYVGKKDDVLIVGNVVSRDTGASMEETSRVMQSTQGALNSMNYRGEMEVLDEYRHLNDESVASKASIAGVTNDISKLKKTIEHRLGASDEQCDASAGRTEKVIQNGSSVEVFWTASDGSVLIHSDTRCANDLWYYATGTTTTT